MGLGEGVGVGDGMAVTVMLKADDAIGKVAPLSSFMTDILPPTPGVAAVVFPIVYTPAAALPEMDIVICAIKYAPVGCGSVERAPKSLVLIGVIFWG